MVDYSNRTEDYDFLSLQEDEDFQLDLVKFFSGGRYKMSSGEMRERGIEGLSKDFVEHMRGQSWNEVTAAKDLNYVLNKDYDEKGKQSFGRLMKAYDSSEAVGGNTMDGVGDFAEAILSAPSTYIGLGSFGIGKVAAKAAGAATGVAVRSAAASLLKKPILKEALIGGATGAVMEAGQGALEGKTRERVIGGYDYTAKDAFTDAAIGGTLGAGLGAFSGYVGNKRQKTVDSILSSRNKVLSKEVEEASKKATVALKKASPKLKKEALKIVADLDDILSARQGVKGAKLKDRLDPERVAKGEMLLKAMSDPKTTAPFESGLSIQTMRSIAAASVDIMDKMKIDDSTRISETVANALSRGDVDGVSKMLTKVRKDYGLNKDEFSLIYLAEASRAGQVLGFQSAISRGFKVKPDNPMDVLFAKGASSLSDEEMQGIAANAVRNSAERTKGNKVADWFRDLDGMRVSLMTSQPATTMRNLRNAGILVTTDLVDEVNKVLYKGLFKGDTKAIKDFIPNASSIIRGYTLNNSEAKILRNIMLDEMPEESKRLYNRAMRIEVALEGTSIMAKTGRFVNLANTASDSVLKEGMFYGSLDRQFRDAGENLGEWLRLNKKLEDVPEGISITKSVEEANRLTMQGDFKGDNSLLASGTKGLVNINRKIPFFVSTAMGVPFPRYMGNHLNMVLEYTPLVGELNAWLAKKAGRSISTVSDDPATRIARQMTGLYGIAGGIALAQMRDGEVDYGSIKNELGSVSDMKPYLGSAMWHTWLGDKLWRSGQGLPLFSSKKDAIKDEVLEVLGGIPDFSFDFGLATGMFDALKEGGTTEKFEKELGNFLSTFTMPAALARDIVGQFDYDQAGSPMVRDMAMSEEKRGDGDLSVAVMQTTRMLPDLDWVQYTQSFDGQNDIPYYRFNNPVAIGKQNPLVKQVTGEVSEPPLTSLEEEMNRYQLKDWQMYNKNTVPNPNIDYVLRQRLAKTMYKDFENWKKQAPASKQYTNNSYDEIQDNEKKAEILTEWIESRIRNERDKVQEAFDGWASKNPHAARGYIRNNYKLKEKQVGEGIFDEAAQTFGFDTADEYIADSENVTQEVNRRQELILKTAQYIPNELY